MNYQKMIVAGNATQDAQQRTAQDAETVYTTFDVAVKDRGDETIYFPVVVFGKQAEAVAQYVTRGRQVLVEGRLELRAQERVTLVANRVVFGPTPKSKPDA